MCLWSGCFQINALNSLWIFEEKKKNDFNLIRFEYLKKKKTIFFFFANEKRHSFHHRLIFSPSVAMQRSRCLFDFLLSLFIFFFCQFNKSQTPTPLNISITFRLMVNSICTQRSRYSRCCFCDIFECFWVRMVAFVVFFDCFTIIVNFSVSKFD